MVILTMVYGCCMATEDSHTPIGRLFPAGGPADPDMVIGRANDVADLAATLEEGVHVLVAGDRRIGKTTICRAVAAQLREKHGLQVVFVEAPERSTSIDLCQLLVDRCLAVDAGGRRLMGMATSLIEKLLADQGIPLDLSSLGPDPVPGTRRAILDLPRRLAAAKGTRILLVFDELQRAAEYADRDELLHDIADLYAGQHDVVVLVDGSHQRTFDALLGTSDGLGKLVHRYELAPTIPRDIWHAGLTDRFLRAGHPIAGDPLEALLDYGNDQPYPTMTAARHSALTAHRLGGETELFCVRDGIEAAERQMEDDGFR
jgi:hypothetical protein